MILPSQILKLSLASLPIFGASLLSAQSVLINFGDDPSITGWNNVPAFSSIGAAMSLVDSDGNASGVSFTLTSIFNSTNSSGAGLDIGDFPAAVTGNSLFGNTPPFGTGSISAPNPSFDIDGLDAGLTYDIQIFASRMGATDNREAQYTISGLGVSTGFLDAADNSSEILTMFDLAPSASGSLSVSIEASENNDNSFEFIYMGAMIVSASTAVPEPSILTSLIAMASIGMMMIRRRR